MIAGNLDAAIRPVCPINGVSIGRPEDKATWRIDFKDEATPAQRVSAQGVLDAFDSAAQTAAELRAEADNTELAAAKADVALIDLINMDPTRIAQAIDSAFTDPVQRAILKRICRVLIPTARRVFR